MVLQVKMVVSFGQKEGILIGKKHMGWLWGAGNISSQSSNYTQVYSLYDNSTTKTLKICVLFYTNVIYFNKMKVCKCLQFPWKYIPKMRWIDRGIDRYVTKQV